MQGTGVVVPGTHRTLAAHHQARHGAVVVVVAAAHVVRQVAQAAALAQGVVGVVGRQLDVDVAEHTTSRVGPGGRNRRRRAQGLHLGAQLAQLEVRLNGGTDIQHTPEQEVAGLLRWRDPHIGLHQVVRAPGVAAGCRRRVGAAWQLRIDIARPTHGTPAVGRSAVGGAGIDPTQHVASLKIVAIGREVAAADVRAAAALALLQTLLVGGFEVDKNVVAVFAQVTMPCGDGSARHVGIAITTAAVRGLRLDALEAAAQDDVDHTGDGVRTVDGRGAILEHLDALHRVQGNGAQVHKTALPVIGQAVRRQPSAVDQHQGGVGTQTPQ